MEPRHRAQVRGQCFALARFKLPDEVVHGLLDKLLCGVVFPAGALPVRRLALVLPCRIFPVRRGAGNNGNAIAGGEGCGAHDGWHDSSPRLLPVVAQFARVREHCLKPRFLLVSALCI